MWLNDALSAGNYFIFLRNVLTACQSLGQLVRVGDARVVPVLDRLNTTLTSNVNCSGPTGGIQLAYEGAQPTSDYLYTWYLGEPAPGGSGVAIVGRDVVEWFCTTCGSYDG